MQTEIDMNQSQEFLEESKAWDDVTSMMNQFETNYSTEVDRFVREACRGIALIDTIAEQKGELDQKAEEIASSIIEKVQKERTALQDESNELADQIRSVQSLEEEVKNLTIFTAEIVSKKREAEQKIPFYKAEAAEEICRIDEIELEHMKLIPKVRNQISMYAELTNIKWDYKQMDALAGEVSLPHKFVHRRFSIEKDLPPFDVAEKIWNIIEG